MSAFMIVLQGLLPAVSHRVIRLLAPRRRPAAGGPRSHRWI